MFEFIFFTTLITCYNQYVTIHLDKSRDEIIIVKLQFIKQGKTVGLLRYLNKTQIIFFSESLKRRDLNLRYYQFKQQFLQQLTSIPKKKSHLTFQKKNQVPLQFFQLINSFKIQPLLARNLKQNQNSVYNLKHNQQQLILQSILNQENQILQSNILSNNYHCKINQQLSKNILFENIQTSLQKYKPLFQ
ncbi:hypothetical protein ABPG74_015418 [Tetrahymena malaccensis]